MIRDFPTALDAQLGGMHCHRLLRLEVAYAKAAAITTPQNDICPYDRQLFIYPTTAMISNKTPFKTRVLHIQKYFIYIEFICDWRSEASLKD